MRHRCLLTVCFVFATLIPAAARADGGCWTGAVGAAAAVGYPTCTSNRLDVYATTTPGGTQDVNLVKVAGSAVSLGQKTSALSIPVVLGSDQSALAVNGTFWQATQPVSGTFFQATQPVSGTFWQATQPVSGAVSVSSIPAITFAAPQSVNAFVGTNGRTTPTSCDSIAAVNISTATTTAVIALSNTNAVYVCGYMLQIISGTLPSFKWEYGTGVACAGGTVVLSGTFGGIAAAVGQIFTQGNGLGNIFITGNSSGLCLVSGGTAPNIQGYIQYALY